MDPKETTNLNQNKRSFYQEKRIGKYRPQNGSHFVRTTACSVDHVQSGVVTCDLSLYCISLWSWQLGRFPSVVIFQCPVIVQFHMHRLGGVVVINHIQLEYLTMAWNNAFWSLYHKSRQPIKNNCRSVIFQSTFKCVWYGRQDRRLDWRQYPPAPIATGSKKMLRNALTVYYISNFHDFFEIQIYWSGIIVSMGSANGRRHYNATPSLIGWAHTQNGSRWWAIFSRGCVHTLSALKQKCQIYIVKAATPEGYFSIGEYLLKHLRSKMCPCVLKSVP